MPEARIGDVVHYAISPDVCRAAIATDPGTDATVRVLDTYSSSDDYTTPALYDTDGAVVDGDGNTAPGPDGFTPGTWHNIH